jgi:hypothetical protein
MTGYTALLDTAPTTPTTATDRTETPTVPTPHPRRATARTLMTGRGCITRRMAALEAAVTVRAARRNQYKLFDAVNVYVTTDRTGAPLIVAYAHYHPNHWDGIADAADLYEIPLNALTDL